MGEGTGSDNVQYHTAVHDNLCHSLSVPSGMVLDIRLKYYVLVFMHWDASIKLYFEIVLFSIIYARLFQVAAPFL